MYRPAAALTALLCALVAAPAISAPPKPWSPAAAEDRSLTEPVCSTCDGARLLDSGRYAEAKRIFERQSERGDVVATYNLGWMYQHGTGLAVDYAKARDLYFQAASGGQNVAMNQMGFLYQHGLGVPQDLATAYCWYNFALANQYAPSATHIAELKTLGVPEPRGAACDVLNHS